MDGAGLKVTKESSFEILFIDSEDKYETRSSFSSPENDKQFQTISKSFTVLPEKYDVENFHSNLEKAKLTFSASLQHLTSSVIESNVPPCQQSDFMQKEILKTDKFPNKCSENSICSMASEENNLCSDVGPGESDQDEEKIRRSSGIQDEKSKQTFQIEKVQNRIGKENFSKNCPVSSDNNGKDGVNSDGCSVKSSIETNRNSDCHATFENVVTRSPARIPKQFIEQIYPQNPEYPELCPIIKPSLKVYKWVRDNKYLQNLVTGAKSSFNSFLNKFEMEINTMLENPVRILIISEVEESLAFKEALLESFSDQVIIARCSEIEDLNSPALPVGYNSALRSLQSKMNNARQKLDCDNYNVILSSTTFVTENVPQRWQMCTALCLEDLDAGLNLHNFSSTTPIPNEYISQAVRLTPKDYPLKELGLAVNLKEATASMIRINSNDMQEFLSGVHHFETLKLAAKVLAGMYGKYISRYQS